jgi:hypothetical protein
MRLPSGNLPTDAQRVLLTIVAAPRKLRAISDLRISGTNFAVVDAHGDVANTGVTDNAGNPLQPNGGGDGASGRAAGNYLATLGGFISPRSRRRR